MSEISARFEVHRIYEDMKPYDGMLRSSGHHGPRVPVAGDADEQSELLVFLTRDPFADAKARQ
jgi:hypothetical protein